MENRLCRLIVPQILIGGGLQPGVEQNSQDHAHRKEVEKGYGGRRGDAEMEQVWKCRLSLEESQMRAERLRVAR